MAYRKFILFSVALSFCFTFFSSFTLSTNAVAKPPFCKSLNGRIGPWEYNVGASFSEAELLLQMFRKKEFDLRVEYFNSKKGYFLINGKQKKNIAFAKIIVDGKTIATYSHNAKKTGKPSNAAWRDKEFFKVYNALLRGKNGQVVITKNNGDVRQFNLALQDFIKGIYAGAPHYKHLNKLLAEKRCRGTYDF
jgi:hypothetical protein